MAGAVLQTVPLGLPWPTIDPFLFCVHHVDDYPAANERFGPAAPLTGRVPGQDFEGRDGWRMYHGDEVPGFPQHPHRGFETITYVRRGLVDHADSLGAAARYGRGDVQWLTAGRGVVHSETFPLLDRGGPNRLELFQIWLNLPSEDKLADPHFTMLWDTDIPRVVPAGADGEGVEVTVIAGPLDGARPPAPPPSSWASRPDSDVAVWHVRLRPGGRWHVPPARPGTARVLYVFDGVGVEVDGDAVGAGTGAVVDATRPVEVRSEGGAEVLVLQGRPIGEPVVQHGPFVMNDEVGVEEAFAEYRRSRFGGWPWPTDEPVHGGEDRFARLPSGEVVRP